jgi:hypothetical protein
MVLLGAVDKDDCGLADWRGLATGIDVGGGIADIQLHGRVTLSPPQPSRD